METPEGNLRDLLEQNIALTKENNRILKDMRRDAIIGGIIKMVIWVLLIGGSFYFSMQFLTPYLSMLEGMQGGGQGLNFEELMRQYQEFTQ